MIGVTLICVGKLKEKFYIDAAGEYTKRLGGYCRIELAELAEERLPPDPPPAAVTRALSREADAIEARIPKRAAVIALCVEGGETDSAGLARIIAGAGASGSPGVCFIVGGSFGLHDRVKARAELRLSMSRMTFPHALARVMLLEQLYRAFNILHGGKYHK